MPTLWSHSSNYFAAHFRFCWPMRNSSHFTTYLFCSMATSENRPKQWVVQGDGHTQTSYTSVAQFGFASYTVAGISFVSIQTTVKQPEVWIVKCFDWPFVLRTSSPTAICSCQCLEGLRVCYVVFRMNIWCVSAVSQPQLFFAVQFTHHHHLYKLDEVINWAPSYCSHP